MEKAKSFVFQLRTWHNDKYDRLSEKLENWVQWSLPTNHALYVCSADEWILRSPCLPMPFYPGNNWNPRHKCHVVPITQHTGSSVIKYSAFIKRKKEKQREKCFLERNS